VPHNGVCEASKCNEIKILYYFYFTNYEHRNDILPMNSREICVSRILLRITCNKKEKEY